MDNLLNKLIYHVEELFYWYHQRTDQLDIVNFIRSI